MVIASSLSSISVVQLKRSLTDGARCPILCLPGKQGWGVQPPRAMVMTTITAPAAAKMSPISQGRLDPA